MLTLGTGYRHTRASVDKVNPYRTKINSLSLDSIEDCRPEPILPNKNTIAQKIIYDPTTMKELDQHLNLSSEGPGNQVPLIRQNVAHTTDHHPTFVTELLKISDKHQCSPKFTSAISEVAVKFSEDVCH